MITSSPNRHTSSSLVINLVIMAVVCLDSSVAFLQPIAYSFPSSSLKDQQPQPSVGFHDTNHLHAPSTTSLSATICPPQFSVLGNATGGLSNPSYSLQNKNPLPFENPEISPENPFQLKAKPETMSTTGKSTFKSQLNSYQPFWMAKGTKPKASTTTHHHKPALHQPTSKEPFYAASFSVTAKPTPRVSKTFAIPKSGSVSMPFNASTNRSSLPKNPIAFTMPSSDTPKQSEPSHPSSFQSTEIPLTEASKSISMPKSNSVSLPFNGNNKLDSTNNNQVVSAADDTGSKSQPKRVTNKDLSRSKNGTLEIKKQWHADLPSAVASTGAKVVETLAKAYAHPPVPVSLPPETSSVIPPSSASSSTASLKTEPKGGDSNGSIDWEARLKTLEQTVASMAQGGTMDISATTTSESGLATSASSPPVAKEQDDRNIIQKLRDQVETLKDTLFDLQQYETKTIHWSIPRIDKHLRLSSSTSFQSEQFYVGSIPLHLELQVQEASGEDDDQSVSLFLYHHHHRSHAYYHPDKQSQYFLRPFQNPRSRKVASHSAPIHLGGSKLKIGDSEYAFGDSAFIEVGKQDGWGWQHLMSLKDMRDHKCIKRGQLDMTFQIRMERENHDSSRVGVAMIS